MLKDGKIVLEKYFGTHTATTPWQWASAGKTITAFMFGIAQQEHYLSINDTTSDYLGKGWTACTQEQEDKITIRHQLSMTSGLDDNVSDNYCTFDTCLIYKADAGTRWAYHNAPYTLLDSVLKIATGTTLNSYISLKLKNQTGMNGLFVPVDFNNVFFSTARSMARFGLLILNKGNWDETPIMTDTNYFNQMVNTSQNINPSYGYLWWLNGKAKFKLPSSQLSFEGPICPNAPNDMIAALGKNGQFLNVVPSQNLVWIRMGESPDAVQVPYLMNDVIWQYINAFKCNTSLAPTSSRSHEVQIFPNPCNQLLSIRSNQVMQQVEIYTVQGQRIENINIHSNEHTLSTSSLSKGVYILKTTFSNGTILSRKIVKE